MLANRLIINLIQDLATPHNNVLIEQLVGRKDVDLRVWYATTGDAGRYQWKTDISNQHADSRIYGSKLNVQFLLYCLSRKSERFVIVGWMNTNTRLLHLLFFLLRRPFNHWTDLPDPQQQGKALKEKLLRWAAYRLLRYSRATVFGVGNATLDRFRSWGFPEFRLVNLPILVAVDENIPAYRVQRSEIHARYGVPIDGFLIVAGSRLTFEKGYDLLVRAIAELRPELREKAKLVIVGSGEEFVPLQQQIADLNLQGSASMEEWMDIEDFKALIANADIFVHPARFDSYGGTILGMALAAAVIGSTGAGAAVDRIEPEVNGILYEATDICGLASSITRLLDDAELRSRLAAAGRETALSWHPSRGAEILIQHLI